MRNRTLNLNVAGIIFVVIALVFLWFSVIHGISKSFCKTHYKEDSRNYYECIYEYKNGMLRHEILDKIPGVKNE